MTNSLNNFILAKTPTNKKKIKLHLSCILSWTSVVFVSSFYGTNKCLLSHLCWASRFSRDPITIYSRHLQWIQGVCCCHRICSRCFLIHFASSVLRNEDFICPKLFCSHNPILLGRASLRFGDVGVDMQDIFPRIACVLKMWPDLSELWKPFIVCLVHESKCFILYIII